MFTLLVFSVILLPFDVGPTKMAFYTIFCTVSTIILFLWFIQQFRSNKLTIHYTPLYFPILAFITIILLSNIWTIDHFASHYKSLYYLSTFFIFFVIYNSPRIMKKQSLFLLILFGFVTMLSIHGLYQFFFGHTQKFIMGGGPFMRAHSIFVWPNTFAGYLVLVWPAMFATYLVTPKNRVKKLLFFGLLLSFGCLVATYSRGGWISFTGAMITLLVLFGGHFVKSHFKDIGLIALLCAIIAGGFLFVPGAAINERASTLSNMSHHGSERLDIWKNSLKVASKHPILGTGIRTFHVTNTQWLPTNIRFDFAHNDYLQLFLEIGIIGLAVFLWIIIKYYHLIWVIWKKTRKKVLNISYYPVFGMIAGTTATFLHSAVDYDFYIPGVLIVFWIFFAFVLDFAGIDVLPTSGKNIIINLSQKYVSHGMKIIFISVIVAVYLFYVFVPTVSQYAVDHGDQYFDEKDLDEAHFWYNVASILAPRYGRYQMKIGSVYSYKAQLEDSNRTRWLYLNLAKERFEKAIELNPYTWRYYEAAAIFYKTHLNYLVNSAGVPAEKFKNAAKSQSETGDSWLQIPTVYEYYKKSIDLYPNNRDLWLSLARSFLIFRDLDSSIVWHEKYIEADSTNHSAFTSYGEALQKNGEYQKSIKNLEYVIENDSTYSYAYFLIGANHLELNQTNRAHWYFEKAVETSTDKESVQDRIDKLLLSKSRKY